MANALGELFGYIAGAIREKSGETGTMKPAEFPEKISAIKTEPVLQDKTISENGTYTADEGFDGLGEVTVEVAGSGGMKGKYKSVTLSGVWAERVSVDFGFTPVMILLFPGSNVTIGTNYMAAVGITNALSEILGTVTRQRYTYVYNGKTKTDTISYPIDTSDSNTCFYNANETGFNLGKTFAAGSYHVYALGL